MAVDSVCTADIILYSSMPIQMNKSCWALLNGGLVCWGECGHHHEISHEGNVCVGDLTTQPKL
jgi:hypothetical protein